MMKSIVKKTKYLLSPQAFRLRLTVAVLLLTILTAMFVIAATDTSEQDSRFIQHTQAFQPQLGLDDPSAATAFIDGEFRALPGFSSHLPLIVIDTGGVEPPVHKVAERRPEALAPLHPGTVPVTMVPIPGVEPDVAGRIYIFDSGERNRLDDTPTIVTPALIRRRGHSSMTFDKPNLRLRLRTETGERNPLPLLGMAADDSWVLNCSLLDRSRMREYMAMQLAAEFMPFTPDVRFSEVFFKEGDIYTYQGIFVLTERIEVAPHRVDLDTRLRAGESSYLIRRDRYDQSRPVLDTWATREGLTYGYLGVFYPRNERLTDNIKRFIEEDISAIERVLYSDDPEVFLTYPNFIDVNSFVDYLILNEFLGNYDAGIHSTYFYKSLGGKLHVGPVWDFDGSIDNYTRAPMRIWGIPFAPSAPWFNRLILHEEFVHQVIERYAQLRRTTLHPDRIEAMVDEIAEYLEPARLRDWKRWEHIYSGGRFVLREYDPGAIDGIMWHDTDESFLIQRHTYTYKQEITKLQYVLRAHGEAMIPGLRWHTGEDFETVSTRDNYRLNSLAATFIVLVIIAAIIIVRRGTR